MSAGRLWRTLRHLTAEQWIYRFLCRGRLQLIQRRPAAAEAYYRRRAAALPVPDPARPALGAIADIVLALQRTVHDGSFAGAADGRFRLLNADFDFGSIEAIAWRGDFREGDNPLRRMVLDYMGYVVPLLADGRRESLDATVRLLRGMEAGNPWSAPGVLRDVWNAYSAAHRLINLLAGLALYRRAGGPRDDAAEAEILGHVRLCAAFVAGNLERDIQFNHLLKNYVALSVFAAACPAVPRALAFLERAVPRSLQSTVLADGGHAERSPMYHALGLLDVRLLAASGLYPGTWQPGLDATLARMTDALGVFTLGDGEIALFNDSWIGEAPPARTLAAPPSAAVARLPVTGYVRLGGGGGDAAVFDCGRCGPDANPGHAHADFLSVEATVGGSRFLVDTGVPTYTAGPARDSSRSAAAHNGPRVAGAEPIEFWKSFRVGRRGDAGELDPAAFDGPAPLFAAGWQGGYAHLGTDVRRFVGLWPGQGLLLADLWRGPRAGDAAVGFLIDGGWRTGADGTLARDGVAVRATAAAGTLSPPRPASHWPRFDAERPAWHIDLAPEFDGDTARAAIFFAWSAAAAVPDAATLADLFARLAAAGKYSASGRAA